MTRFGLIGVAGYVAERHLRVIADLGHEVVTACDLGDSVGRLDRHFPHCRFSTDPVWWFCTDLQDVDCVVVCTPNHLHLAHAFLAAEAECDVIVEKPVGMSMSDPYLDQLPRSRIYPVVQLRHFPGIKAAQGARAHVEIVYQTYRGPWYDASWKGDEERSGGVLMNIGVHFIDLCHYLFGDLVRVNEAEVGPRDARGHLTLDRADVTWTLSTSRRQACRRVTINGCDLDMTSGIDLLHTQVYRHYLSGQRWPLDDCLRAVATIDAIKELSHGR